MKKIFHLFFIVAAMLAVSLPVGAAPYLYEFEVPLDVSNHAFAPAGWGHIVDGHNFDGEMTYVEYTYVRTGGVDDSGALKVGSQMLYDEYEEESYAASDLLVTPLIKANSTASIAVKKAASNGVSLEFFVVTKDANGKFKAGSKLYNIDTSGLNSTDFVTVNIPAQNSDYYLGIKGSMVYLDNFMAADADVLSKQELNVSKVESQMGGNYAADANDRFTISYKVNVTNSGTLLVNPDSMPAGKEASVSLINATKDSTVLATVKLPAKLDVGESAENLELKATVDAKDYPGKCKYIVRENVSGTFVEAGEFRIIGHSPVLEVAKTEVSSAPAIGNDSTVRFTLFSKTADCTYYVRNAGGSTLHVTGVSTTDNLSAAPAGAFAVEPGSSTPLKLTLKGDKAGAYDSHFELTSDGGTFRMNFTGEVADSTKFFAGFEDGIPAGFFNEGDSWSTNTNPASAGVNGSKRAVQPGYSSADSKLVTPLLSFTEGEKLRFDVERNSSYSECKLQMFTSVDRIHWTLQRSYSSTAEKGSESFITDSVGARSGYSSTFAFDTKYIAMPAGQYYVAFTGSSVCLDNLYGGKAISKEHDIVLSNLDIPAEGEVNSSYAASVSFTNVNAKEEAAEDYTAKLYFGGKAVAEATPVALAGGATKEFKFNFIPQEAGTFKAVVKFESGSFEVVSDTVNVTIDSEKAVMVVEAPKYTDIDGLGGPVKFSSEGDGHSQTETIYKASQLGLAKGTKISKIVFRGYGNVYGNRSTTIHGFYEETTDETVGSELADTTKMQKVYDETLTFSGAVGSDKKHADIITVEFATPKVYNGGNIRLVFTNYMKQSFSLYFEHDKDNAKKQSRSYYYDWWGKATQDYQYQPTAYFYVGTEPHSATGKVTSKATGAAIKGAKVEFNNNGVIYKGVTDAEGKYDILVYKYAKAYNLTVSAPGYLPAKESNVSLSAGNYTKDFALSVADRLFVEDFSADTTGMVNHALKANVVVTNYLTSDVSKDNYTVKLFAGEKEVASVPAVNLPVGGSASFSFVYTPHEAGTVSHHAEVVLNGSKSTLSKEVSTVVAKENGNITIPTGTSDQLDYMCPVYSYWVNSESQIIYPAQVLNLQKGARIQRISFKGYASTSEKVTLRAYLANTTDANSLSAFAPGDSTQMQKVFEGEITIPNTGSFDSTVEVISLPLNEPLVYEGNNLRLFLACVAKNSFRIYVEDDSNQEGYAYYRFSDYDITEKNYSVFKNGTPVMYIDAATSSRLSGKVTDSKDGKPVTGAVVTLVNKDNDVVYTATTADDGSYTLESYQPSLAYTVSVSAEGYEALDGGSVVFAGEDVERDFKLTAKTPTGIDAVKTKAEADGNVYTLDGRLVSRKGDTRTLPAGVYIINHKKVVVR